jgi:uncharacterized protein
MEWSFDKIITSEEELRTILGHPNEIVTRKTINHIDANCRDFIENSPFITIATSDLNGNFDVSPKGDPPGFVKILTDRLLAIPDRPGNKKADTFTNILQNPNVGLIFLIPGIKETLRVNGTAKIVTDKKVLELLTYEGKLPLFAIIVEVKEAFMHCAKCMIRSKLWMNNSDIKERTVPSLAKSMVEHTKLNLTIEEMDDLIKNDEKTNLY